MGDPVLVPLVLSQSQGPRVTAPARDRRIDQFLRPNILATCVLCDQRYTIGYDPDTEHGDGDLQMLAHLLFKHNLVIADVSQIASLSEYLLFWKEKFKDKPIREYCSTLLLDKKPDGTYSKDEKYYLLSDVLPADYELRRNLQTKRLEKILAYHKLEREDLSYERECLFCRTVVEGSRSDFLEHLFAKHNFYVARSDNLVFIGELIEMLSDKLENRMCIYCEKVFKDRTVLKEHMRKKSHKRINPENKAYDKFFISNYLEVGRNWQTYLKNANSRKQKKSTSGERSIVSAREASESSDDDDNWSDWEETGTQTIVCLFCDHRENEYTKLSDHLVTVHHFDFESLTEHFNFYEKVKIVNYIRRRIHSIQCIKCDSKFENIEKLLKHMCELNHLNISECRYLWNQPEFFFPTYEDDGLLCCLVDKDENLEGDDCSVEVPTNIISDASVKNIIQSSIEKLSEEMALSVIYDE